MDSLLGVSNTKQTVDFWATSADSLNYSDRNERLPEGVQREILFSEITESVTRCIREMRKYLNVYAQNFIQLENSFLSEKEEAATPIPQAEPAVIEVIPKGETWSEDAKEDVARFLKERYMHLTQEVISLQVENYARGLTKTLVIYSPNATNQIFEIKELRGRLITLINTNHVYYKNVIEPLKHHSHLKVFAIAIEMFISSAALEMDRLTMEDTNLYKIPLERYLEQFSSRLNAFIVDSHIKIVPEYFDEPIQEE